MTLNVSKPEDTDLISSLPAYIREDRAAINAISGGGNVGFTDLEVALGTTSLTIGSELGSYGFEIIKATGLAAVILSTILGGIEGQVKVFLFQDGNISLTDGTKSNGKFYLNQLPALSDYVSSENAILALVNIGGDGATNHGYWKELYRTAPVK